MTDWPRWCTTSWAWTPIRGSPMSSEPSEQAKCSWDGTGLAAYKRLERAGSRGRCHNGVMRLTRAQFEALFEVWTGAGRGARACGARAWRHCPRGCSVLMTSFCGPIFVYNPDYMAVMQSRLQPVDIKALPPAHRAIFQAQQTQRRASREGGFAHRYQPPPGTPHRRCAGRSTKVREAPVDDRQLAFEDLEGAVAEAEDAAARAPQQVRPPPVAVPLDAISGICPGAWNASNTSSNRQHAVPLRVRPDDPHRRGPHRAAGHRAGAAAGHRRCARSTPAAPARLVIQATSSPADADRGGAGAG